jgi:hypothetical protein
MNNKHQQLFDILNRNSVETSMNDDLFLDGSAAISTRLQQYQEITTEYSADHYRAEDDCPNIELCRKMQISRENICTKGSDTRLMCSFGESRIITLLANLSSR